MKKLFRIVHKLFIVLLSHFFLLLPLKKNKIYFISNAGKKYGCHPRAFYEFLVKNHSDEFVFHWALDDKNEYKNLSKNTSVSKFFTLKDFYHYYTSKFIINNTRSNFFYLKKKKQFYVHTWHAGPFGNKYIEKDTEKTLSKNYVRMAKKDSKKIDLLMTGSDNTKEIFRSCFWYDGEISNFGTPRYDKLLSTTKKQVSVLKKKLGLDKNKFYILYAPTFRDNFNIDDYKIEEEKIINAFEKKIGKKCVFIYKLHPNIIGGGIFGNNKNIYDFTNYPDLIDLVLCFDVLISDYSSCMYDMMFLNKPCFLLAKDLKSYLKNERGLYIKLTDKPFPLSYSEDELIKQIKKYDFDKDLKYFKKREEFKRRYNCTEKGESCKKLYEILKKIK